MPAPVDLTKPGRRYVIEETALHRVYAHQHGCMEIERLTDGATAFFQGDDASILGDEMFAAIGRPARVMRDILDQYDDILTVERPR